MMPRKKRRMITIGIILLFILILAIAFILVYMNTDMFKSSRTLFIKYMGQNVENLNKIYSDTEENQLNEMLQNNKYEANTNIKVNYTKNIGTTAENNDNPINQLELSIKEQADKSQKYTYQDIQLLNKEEKITELEYVENEEKKAIKFSDLFNQYIGGENEALKSIFSNGDSDEVSSNSINVEEIQEDLKNIFTFSEEQKKNMQKKYINIINRDLSKDNFTKQKNQTIQINEKSINVNAYILTQPKEKMNQKVIQILEEIKQDADILEKVKQIDSLATKYKVSTNTDFRKQFIEQIENLIDSITKNNIGQEQAKMIVYENYHNTVRTEFQSPDFEFTIDFLSLSTEEYRQITYQNTKEGKKQKISYKKEETGLTADFEVTDGKTTKKYSITRK